MTITETSYLRSIELMFADGKANPQHHLVVTTRIVSLSTGEQSSDARYTIDASAIDLSNLPLSAAEKTLVKDALSLAAKSSS